MLGPVMISSQNLDCCGWVQHQISSASQKLCGLCSTDCKVYTLLVLGRIFQAAAVTTLLGSITFTFVVGPVALFGLIVSVAMGVFGTSLAGSKEQIQEIIEMARPFVPGQPVGLRNSGGNCWLNSGLQMLANLPLLAERLRQFPEFAAFIHSYQAARGAGHKVATDIDTHQLRQVLNRATAGIIEPGPVQEDAAQLFECLFQGRHSLHTFDQQLNGAPAASRSEPLVQLDLGRGVNPLTFEQSLNLFFDHNTDLGQRQQLFFQRPPRDLLIQLIRFYRDPDGTSGKMNSPVDVPAMLQFPSRFVRTAEQCNYACDAFLSHCGTGLDGGHYVSYIKRGETWWYCSDSSIFEVSKERAETAMQQSYILHFARV